MAGVAVALVRLLMLLLESALLAACAETTDGDSATEERPWAAPEGLGVASARMRAGRDVRTDSAGLDAARGSREARTAPFALPPALAARSSALAVRAGGRAGAAESSCPEPGIVTLERMRSMPRPRNLFMLSIVQKAPLAAACFGAGSSSGRRRGLGPQVKMHLWPPADYVGCSTRQGVRQRWPGLGTQVLVVQAEAGRARMPLLAKA